jgi:CheY-like chemotaxis protein
VDKGLPGVKIVALTAHAMNGDGDKFKAAGMNCHLTKPIKRNALVEHLDLVRDDLGGVD